MFEWGLDQAEQRFFDVQESAYYLYHPRQDRCWKLKFCKTLDDDCRRYPGVFLRRRPRQEIPGLEDLSVLEPYLSACNFQPADMIGASQYRLADIEGLGQYYIPEVQNAKGAYEAARPGTEQMATDITRTFAGSIKTGFIVYMPHLMANPGNMLFLQNYGKILIRGILLA